MTGREPPFAHHGHPGADSAGVPWQGRSFRPTGFEGDDGGADPEILALLQRGPAALPELVAALPDRRLLVPVVAHRGEQDEAAETGDKSADMAMVTLTAPDGRKAMPVFTSTAALAAWSPAARPVPTPARRAAVAAVDDGCQLLVMDPVGPSRLVVTRPALWALAKGEPYVPFLADRPAVTRLVAALRASTGVARTVHCEAGRRAEVAVVVTLPPGLGPADLDAVTAAVGGVLSHDETVAQRIDSVELRFEG